MSDKPAFLINGHPVAGSFYGLVLRHLNGDRHAAALVFFRCAQANPDDPIKWVRAGLSGPRPYALRPCKAEESGGSVARAWIAANIESRAGMRRGMVQMKEALGAFLADLSKQIQAMPVEAEPAKRRKSEPLEQLKLF